MNKHFNIESYEIAENKITVILEKYSIAIPVIIPQDKFEWWLKINDKLRYELNTSDHTGQHHQFEATLSLGEYWDTATKYINQDLYDYICSNPISRDDVVYSNSVDSLNLAFDLHNAKRINPVFNIRWEHDQEIFEQVFN